MNAAFGLFLSIALLLPAPPRPNTVPQSWDLLFNYDDIQRITVDLPNDGGKATYWYLIYTVTNDSGREVAFYPAFEVLTNRGRRIKSGLGVPPAAFVAIKNRHARSHPFLADYARILGTLRQSSDQAKDGVAIWPDFSAAADHFTVFVSGLSGESTEIPNPEFDPAEPETVNEKLADGTTIPRRVNPRMFSLHKTLAIDYDLPGDPSSRPMATPVRTGQKWVMR